MLFEICYLIIPDLDFEINEGLQTANHIIDFNFG